MGLMIRKALVLLASLIFLITSFIFTTAPSFAFTPDTYATSPSQGEVLGIWDDIRGKVEGFVGKVWEFRQCVTDLDCVSRNFITAILNTLSNVLIGVPFTELNDQEITAMLNGKWDVGLAFTGATIIDGAYIDPPGLRDLHLASYLKYELSDNLLSRRAYATTGEVVIAPAQSAWEGVRDATYGFFMLIMIVIGFMIMLRKQIAPRIVVSFTAALPRIVMGLILITFSFSLIALAFDVVGVFGSEALLTALRRTPGWDTPPLVTTPEQYGGVVGTVLGPGAAELIGESLVTIFASVGDLEQAGPGDAFKTLVCAVLFLLVLAFALFAVAIQLIFRIAKLLIKAILSPLIFLLGTLPGQEGSITNFAKGLIADCAAFPAIAFMLGIIRLFLREVMVGHEPAATIKQGIVGNVYMGAGLVALVIIFLVMAFAAPFYVEKALTSKR